MHPLLAGLDRADTKNTIRDLLIENAAYLGAEISRAKADKAAQAFKRGRLDDMTDLARVIGWADPTGERATENAMRAA